MCDVDLCLSTSEVTQDSLDVWQEATGMLYLDSLDVWQEATGILFDVSAKYKDSSYNPSHLSQNIIQLNFTSKL